MSGGERAFPLVLESSDDPRFTNGLAIDVADVLAQHGYPRPTSAKDWVELQQALFRFIYCGGAQ